MHDDSTGAFDRLFARPLPLPASRRCECCRPRAALVRVSAANRQTRVDDKIAAHGVPDDDKRVRASFSLAKTLSPMLKLCVSLFGFAFATAIAVADERLLNAAFPVTRTTSACVESENLDVRTDAQAFAHRNVSHVGVRFNVKDVRRRVFHPQVRADTGCWEGSRCQPNQRLTPKGCHMCTFTSCSGKCSYSSPMVRYSCARWRILQSWHRRTRIQPSRSARCTDEKLSRCRRRGGLTRLPR